MRQGHYHLSDVVRLSALIEIKLDISIMLKVNYEISQVHHALNCKYQDQVYGSVQAAFLKT